MAAKYRVGQEVEIVERFRLARCSGSFAGPAKYTAAKVLKVWRGYAELSTGERIDIATGKLVPGLAQQANKEQR